MSGEIRTTLIGNLTGDPELRVTPSGDAVANFTVAINARRLDKATNTWVDGDATFVRVAAWRTLGENVAESLVKGDRVLVYGVLQQRNWETPEGEKRSTIEMNAEDVGASLTWATVTVTKTERAQAPTKPETSAKPAKPAAPSKRPARRS